MKIKHAIRTMAALCILQSLPVIALATMGAFCLSAVAQPMAFTYQGVLNDSGSSANGSFDLKFTLHNAATNGVEVSVLTNAVRSSPTGCSQ